MTKGPAADALDRARLLAVAGRFTDLADAELLQRCVAGPDEAAFTALVERHGAMVYSVCSRMLRDAHDAEDACQATFLVLARKASSIRKRPSIASWLHGVARRSSLSLLRKRAARQRHERKAAEQPTSVADPRWSEVLVLLDHELERLPERLRGPIVLCYLQGKTRDEAATALGITPGRLHGLLQRGRALLHDRLARSGVTFGAGLLTVGLSSEVGLALPANLAIRIIHGATATRSGQELVPGLVTAQTTSIANEVLRAMFYAKVKVVSWWSAGLGVVAFALIGSGLFAPGQARDEEKKTDRPPVVVPAAKPDPKAASVEVRKIMTMPTDAVNDFRHAAIVVSSEQKSVLSRNLIVTDQTDPKAHTSGLHLWTLDGEKSKRTNLGDSTTIGFVPKSTLAFSVGWGEGVVFWDTRTHAKVGKPIPHELREDTMPLPAVSPDGQVMATRSKLDHVQFWDIKTSMAIAPAIAMRGIVWTMEFSADRRWLFSVSSPRELHIWDGKTGKQVAGPFRHDVYGGDSIYSSNKQQVVTVENTRDKDGEGKSEAIIRSTKDWSVVQRVKLTGHAREVKWIDDNHLLVVGDERTKPDAQGRPASFGRNVLYVVKLDGDKSEVQTILRNVPWIPFVAVPPGGKHIIAGTTGGETTCWKLGEPKPIWSKFGGRTVQMSSGDWVLLTGNGKAIMHSLDDGKELWRQENIEDAKVQGPDIWIFGQKSVDILRVDFKTK